MKGDISMENQKQFETWHELLKALETEYTTSFKDVCKIFKASRAWVTKYIKPRIRSIYINNNRRGDIQCGVNWTKIASKALNKSITESTWFHTDELLNFIENTCVYSITKQTKSVPVTYLMDEIHKKEYLEMIDQLNNSIANANNLITKSNLIRKSEMCYLDYIKDTKAQTLCKKQQDIVKRTLAEPVEVNLNIRNIYTEWVAPHEKKDYGDTDESVYRFFFKNGYVRIELHIPDVNGEVGKKIFYIPDTEYLEDSRAGERRLILSEKDWRIYQEQIENEN